MALFKNKYFHYFLSVLFSVGVVYALWDYVQWERRVNLEENLNWLWVISIFVLFIFYQGLRVIRLRLATQESIPLLKGSSIMAIQSVVNATLPAGLGEVFLVWILRNQHNIDWKKGTSAIIMVRLADLFIFVLLFILVALFARDIMPPALVPVMIGVATLTVGGCMALFGIHKWRQKQVAKNGIINAIDQILGYFAMFKNPRVYIPILLLTAIMWAMMFGIKVGTVYGMNYALPLIAIFWIYMVPTDLLPVKGIANIGSYELSWFIVLNLLGYTAEDAATLAFGSHILVLALRFGAGLLGLTFLAFMGIKKRKTGRKNGK